MVKKESGSLKETTSFSHTPGWKGWINDQVQKGNFRNKSDVIESALKMLKEKTDPHTSLSKFTS